MTTAAQIAMKDAERAEIERLFADWTAAGNMPELSVSCRQEKTMMNMRELNACTWEDRK